MSKAILDNIAKPEFKGLISENFIRIKIVQDTLEKARYKTGRIMVEVITDVYGQTHSVRLHVEQGDC